MYIHPNIGSRCLLYLILLRYRFGGASNKPGENLLYGLFVLVDTSLL